MNGPLQVFLSYRRDDDAARALSLRLIINAALNADPRRPRVEVFHDTRQRPGVSWPDEVRQRLDQAEIVLAVIGPRWVAARDFHERRRIDQADDWVRRELDGALSAGKVVVPIVFEAEPPPAEALPESLRALATRQMVQVRDDHAEDDLQPLLLELERRLGEEPRRMYTQQTGTQELPYPDPPLPILPAPLSEEDLESTLTQILVDWRLLESPLPEDPAITRQELFRELRFDSFVDAVRFMLELVPVIDQVNHHPRWENVYRTLRVFLSTWDIGHRVSYADVMLAQAFDRAFGAYVER